MKSLSSVKSMRVAADRDATLKGRFKESLSVSECRVWWPLQKMLTIFNIFANFSLDFMIYNNFYLYTRIFSLYLVS